MAVPLQFQLLGSEPSPRNSPTEIEHPPGTAPSHPHSPSHPPHLCTPTGVGFVSLDDHSILWLKTHPPLQLLICSSRERDCHAHFRDGETEAQQRSWSGPNWVGLICCSAVPAAGLHGGHGCLCPGSALSTHGLAGERGCSDPKAGHGWGKTRRGSVGMCGPSRRGMGKRHR